MSQMKGQGQNVFIRICVSVVTIDINKRSQEFLHAMTVKQVQTN